MTLTDKGREVVDRVQELSDAHAEVLNILETVVSSQWGESAAGAVVHIPAPLLAEIRRHLA